MKKFYAVFGIGLLLSGSGIAALPCRAADPQNPATEMEQKMNAESSSFPANWQWKLFAAPKIPSGMFDHGETVTGSELALPDGRKLTAKPVHFPESGIVDLKPLMGFEPEELSRSVMVADFDEPEACERVLGIGVDWEFTLYCNGKQLASTFHRGNGETVIRPDNHLLRLPFQKGHNQIILEIYNGTFQAIVAAKLLSVGPLELKYEPWVDFPDAAAGAVTVVFTTNRPAPAGVDFRKAGSENWTRIYDNLGGQIRRDRDVHAIRIAGLEPDTEYEYRAVLIDLCEPAQEAPFGPVRRFRTAPAPGKAFSFVATADLQLSTDDRTAYLQQLFQRPEAAKADFFAFLGDVEWTSDMDQTVIERMILPFRRATDFNKMLVMVRGNHEIYGQDTNRFFDYFSAPAPGREGYTMFRWGDVCFIQLDFCDDCGRCPAPSTRYLHDFEPYIAAEAAWLKQAVELPVCKDAKYRIVLAHGVALGDLQSYLPNHVKQVIDPVFAGKNPKCRIDLWIGGHVHYALRSIPGENAWRCGLDLRTAFANRKDMKLRTKDGEKYFFPVVVFSGPRKGNPPELQVSSIAVQVSDAGIEVTSSDRNGKEFDRFRVDGKGNVTELGSAEWFRRWDY